MSLHKIKPGGILIKTFDLNSDIKYVPISKTDLKDLEEIVMDNNHSDKNFIISTTINMLTIKENSIAALLEHKEIPDRLNNFDIKVYTYNKHNETEQYINLHVINKYVSFLNISGSDEVWVRGKFQQIEEFITNKLYEFNKEEKLAGKIEVPTNKEENDKTVISENTNEIDGNSKLTKVGAQIAIITKNINRVFVVHGHDGEMKHAVARVLKSLNLEPIILQEKPNENRTLIEKLEQYSDVDFAVVLLSPDDIAYEKEESETDGKFRARQNVILELGYFLGKLDRHHVFVLYRESNNLEIPSDYFGVLLTKFDESETWKFKMGREMQVIDPKIDLNQLLK